MEEKGQQWKTITEKLQRVQSRYQALEKENDQLHKEVQLLREREQSALKKTADLEMKLVALQTAAGRLDEADRKEVDKRLNLYIRELDRCIAMLGD